MTDTIPAPEATAPGVEDAHTVRRRAGRGALLIGARTLVIRVLGMAGSIVLAHFLTPSAFGIVAFGTLVVTAGSVLTDGGLGAALIRGPDTPTRAQLRSVLGYQLAGTTAFVALIALVALLIGGQAMITVVMACSLPVLCFQTPGAIVLERALDYQPIAIAEVLQIVVYNLVAVVSVVALGAGVWGIAIATVLGAVTATVMTVWLSGVGLMLPSLALDEIRSLLGFGVRFQAMDIVGLVRDQGLNLMAGALGSLGTLGLWSMVYRVLQPGTLIFETLRRVSYPGMARLRDLGQDSSELVGRALSLTCVAASLVLVPLAACARSLVPFVFGARWGPCADTVAMGAWAMLLSGPLSVAAAGYLLAAGEAADALGIVLVHAWVGLATAALLLPLIGIDALGIAALAMGVADVVTFGRALRRHVPGLTPERTLAVPLCVCAVGTLIGWWIRVLTGHGLVSTVMAAAAAGVAVLAGHLLTDEPTVVSLWSTVARAAGRGQPA